MSVRFLTLLFLAFLVPFHAFAGPEEKHSSGYSLYVSECPTSPCVMFDFVRYQFKKGVLQPKIILASFPTSYIRFDISGGRVVDNRYLVPGIGGGAIDTKNGKQIWDSDLSDQLKNEIEKSGPVTSHESFLLRAYSADRTKSAYSSRDGEIYTKDINGTKTVLATGLSIHYSQKANEMFEGAPLLWIDNDRIITQQQNGKIVLIHVSDKQSAPELIANIPVQGAALISPSFALNPDGTVIYSIFLDKVGEGENYFKIDVEGKKYEPYTYMPQGNDFEIELAKDAVQNIHYRGKSIGSYWCGAAKTTDGYIAIPYGRVASNLGYPKGIAVWNADSGKWTEINPESHIFEIIGWVKE